MVAMTGPWRPRRAALAAPLLALLLPLPAGPARAQEGEPRHYVDGVVAIVEGEPITRYQLELACRLVTHYRDGSPEQRKAILQEQLKILVEEKLLLLQARERGLAQLSEADEARIEWELERAASDHRGIAGLRLALQEIGVPYEYFVERKRTNVIIGKLLVSQISRDIFITPEQIREHYRLQQAEFAHPGEVRIRQIVVFPDPAAAYRVPPAAADLVARGQWDPASYAEALRARVLAGEPFEEVVRQGSMVREEDLGEQSFPSADRLDQMLVRPLPERVRALQVGEVSEVIRSSRGSLHVIKLIEQREPGVLPLGEVQDEIEARLREQVWQRRMRDWIDHLHEEAYVQRFLELPE